MRSTVQQTPTLWYHSVLQPLQSRHPDQLITLIETVDRLRKSTHGLNDAVLEEEKAAAAWFLEGLYQAYFSHPRTSLGLPKSRRFYVVSHPIAVPFSFGAMERVIKAAAALGWIKVQLGVHDPDGQNGTITTFEASGELAAQFACEYYEWTRFQSANDEALILVAEESQRKHRRRVVAHEAPQVMQWQVNLRKINDLFLSRCIYLDAPNDVILDAATDLMRKADGKGTKQPLPLNFSHVRLRRIFARGRLDHGGRFYGGWWQFIPSKYRKYVAIDGSLTAEADYSAMALTSLYALDGKDIGEGDLYDIGLSFDSAEDPRRKIVKRYVNAVLNDEKGTYRLPHEEQRMLGISAKELRERVKIRHSPVSRHFHSGIGLHLQFLESEIAEQVMLRFASQGEVCLPVHDSFIVRDSLIDTLVGIMQEEFERKFGRKVKVKPDEVFMGERMAIPDPSHIPVGLRPDEQAEALRAIHWGRMSIATRYYTSWVMNRKTEEEINVEYEKMLEMWRQIRPRIAEATRDIRFP